MNIIWTIHSKDKMRFYGLSENRIKRVINNPKRKELGIAPGTVAAMQPNSSKHTYEIWVMYLNLKGGLPAACLPVGKGRQGKIKIITAWKYPGKSPIRGPIPIPPEILEELGEISNKQNLCSKKLNN